MSYYPEYLGHSFEWDRYTKGKSMSATKKSKCEHLNVETKKIGSIPMAVCKDCLKAVDPNEFEVAEALKTEVNGQTQVTDYKKVLQLEVDSLIDPGKKDIPSFFPVFSAKPGDLVVILRKKKMS